VDPNPQFWAVGPEGPEGIPALHPLAHPPHSHPYTRHPPTRSSKSFLLHSHIPILFLHRPGARSPPSAVPSFSHSHKPLSSRPHARSLIPAVTANANANATSDRVLVWLCAVRSVAPSWKQRALGLSWEVSGSDRSPSLQRMCLEAAPISYCTLALDTCLPV
jgi:hypothetical protein